AAAEATLKSGLDDGEQKPHPDLADKEPAAERPAAQQYSPSTIKDTLAVFERWLILPNRTPVYAVLGTVAANLLPGDPIWLGVTGPPSSANTEILNSISLMPCAYEYLQSTADGFAETSAVATAIELPTTTARRALEDLAAYQLAERISQGPGKPDLWKINRD